MKYLLLFSGVVLTTGLLLKEEYFTVNIHDTYFITSYFIIAVLLVASINSIFILNYFLKKILRR